MCWTLWFSSPRTIISSSTLFILSNHSPRSRAQVRYELLRALLDQSPLSARGRALLAEQVRHNAAILPRLEKSKMMALGSALQHGVQAAELTVWDPAVPDLLAAYPNSA